MPEPISGNRFGWLKQAATEGPIIVASILLAFAIDAGWDARSERIERRLMLESLREEFSARQEGYDRLTERLEGRLTDVKLLLTGPEALQEGRGRVNNALFDLVIVSTIDPGLGVIDAVISSGRLEMVHDLELRARLARWQSVVDEVRDNQEVMRQLSALQLVPYLAASGIALPEAISVNGPAHHLWPAAVDWPVPEGSVFQASESTYRQVLADSEFQSYASVRYLWLAWTITELAEARAEIVAILDGLDKELSVD